MSLKKKLLAACAGLMLAGSSVIVSPAFAADNPLETPAPANQPIVAAPRVFTHVGEIEGIPVVLQFSLDHGALKGTLMVGKQSYPVTGTMDPSNQRFVGKWNNNGIENDFVADADMEHGRLILKTNGKNVALKMINPQAANQQPPANVLEKPAVQDGPSASQVQIVNGKFFTVPVPQGWKHMEQMGETVVISPDGKTAYGLVGRPTRATTPEEFAKEFFEGYKVTDLKIISSQPFDAGNGQKGLDAIVSFTGGDGVARTGAIKVVLMQGPQGAFAMLLHAATPKENEANLKTTAGLAMQIKVVNQQQPAQGGAQAGLQY